MKNIKIFPKEWLKLHPYAQSGPVDSYYTSLANRILDIMESTDITNSLTQEEAKSIALRISAYFEDVISQLNIWKTFLTEHKKLYGKFIPFYAVDDHYYDDEVNQEDVNFLLWHLMQQYRGQRKGTFLSPDNETTLNTANQIYQLLCEEWTTAPENERMQEYLSADHKFDDDDELINIVDWFHYNSYLFPQSQEEFSEIAKDYLKDKESDLKTEDMVRLYDFHGITEPTLMFGYTAPKLLSLIIPESHPDYDKIIQLIDKYEYPDTPENLEIERLAKEEFEKFKEVTNGKTLIYFSSEKDLKEFVKNNINDNHPWLQNEFPSKSALGATKEHGMEAIFSNLESINDKDNPFYNKEMASKNAIAYFVVSHATPSLLRELETNGMLSDATANSCISEERAKRIIHDNWDFLMRYFLRVF